MSASIYSAPIKAIVQFGNPSDSSGYKVAEAEIIAERKGMCGRMYLVRDGKTYGLATFNSDKGQYCSTFALTLGAYFMGQQFTAESLARHFSFPAEVFI